MKQKFIGLLFVLLSVNLFSYSQDTTFNSFGNEVFTSMYSNPSYAGGQKNCNVYLIYNKFYTGLNDLLPYNYLIMADIPFGKKKQFGLGLTYLDEETYTIKVKQVVASFSGSADIFSNTVIRYGLSYSPFFKVSSEKNISDLVFQSQMHPAFGPVYPTFECIESRSVKVNGNIKGGIWIDNKNFFFGLSFFNFYFSKKFIDDEKEYKQKQYLNLFPAAITAGYNFRFKDVCLTPVVNALFYENDNKNRARINAGITGIYRGKYLLSVTCTNRFSLYDISAGAWICKRYKLFAAYGLFSNVYLRNITGAAYVSLGLNVQLTKR